MNTPQTFSIKGMHCASCSSIIEKEFKKADGVISAEVNYGTETAKVVFDENKTNAHALSKTIERLGYSIIMPKMMNHEMAGHGMAEDHSEHSGISQSKAEKLSELTSLKRKVISVIPLALFSIFVMGWDILAEFKTVPLMPYFWEEFFHHLLPIFATYTLFVVGKPYLKGLYRFIRYGKADMDALIGIGTLAAFIYSFIVTAFEESLKNFIDVSSTYYDVTIIVITFITLGKYLEARSKLKTGDAIEKLLNLQAKTALVIRAGKEVEISINDVVHGDIVIVKSGTKIPVDGIIVEGSSYVDESMVTGEPVPAEKNEGDMVIAGTINTTGTFTFKATKVGSETLLAHIIRMVQEAQGSKAPIQALADKISSIFVPAVVVLSFISLGTWLVIAPQYLGFSQALSYGLVSFVGILVIACPCALGLATPTAIIVGVGKGAREGILVKDAATLQKLHKVSILVVDKTGTITKGKPELVSIQPQSGAKELEVITLLGSLETRSEHPIAHAVATYAKEKNIALEPVKDFQMIKGKGVCGKINNIEYFAGNTKLMEETGLKINRALLEKETKEGKTPVILATKEKVLGIVMVADAIKPEAKEAVSKLHKLGIKILMLTGDNKNTAHYIAELAGIDEVLAEMLPADKMAKIKELQAQGLIVAMTGDGVNDAPALAQADVGIAMSTGTDVAIESAGITLLHGDISKLVKAIRLSKITMRGIKQNLFWAFFYNIVGIPLAAGVFYPLLGWMLNPVFAGMAMAFSSVSVVSNSLRLKLKKL
jgi:Cu2+-exporting ATPase/Cu+-exporting ATPase